MSAADAVRNAVDPERLMRHAVELVSIPSPTRSAAQVADRLSDLLRAEGFEVERPAAGWPDAPAVVARLQSPQPGKTLQFNGHLDTVHLPFIDARIENGILYGSGASDMKGGVAAMLEAMLALRDADALHQGGVLFTAHDLHEAPWGDGSQVNGLIDEGYIGDGVLLPEYCCDRLPVVGRGLAVLEIDVRRDGQPLHEMLGGIEQPNVIWAAAEILGRFEQLDGELSGLTHDLAGRESVFVGKVEAGEIFNQSPTSCRLSGTRRWLPGTSTALVQQQVQQILDQVAETRGVQIESKCQIVRDAYEISPEDALAQAVQSAYQQVTSSELPVGAKPFVDDGNAFTSRGGIPAVTHGPNATGAHTLNEECPVDELVRIAHVYALAALDYC